MKQYTTMENKIMKIKLFQLMICFITLNVTVFAQTPTTRICDFDGDKANSICQLKTTTGIGTTFQLPEGMEISDFVVTNPTNFHSESNGYIGIVTPRRTDVSTSVNIISNNNKLFVFYLESLDNLDELDQLAIVKATEYKLFQNNVRNAATLLIQEQRQQDEIRYEVELDKRLTQAKRQMLFTLNTSYRIIGDGFPIDGISDDGVFTYVNLTKSIERPPVYLGESAKPKQLEVLKYTDEGDHYVIHRVLTSHDKGFVLKLGDKTVEIRRR